MNPYPHSQHEKPICSENDRRALGDSWGKAVKTFVRLAQAGGFTLTNIRFERSPNTRVFCLGDVGIVVTSAGIPRVRGRHGRGPASGPLSVATQAWSQAMLKLKVDG